MNILPVKLNIASYYLVLILLTIGIKSPELLHLSSLSILVMIIAVFHLTLISVRPKIHINRKFLAYNIIFFCIVVFYTIIAIIKGKLIYPTYPINIIFFQIVFFLIIQKINTAQLIKIFLLISLINLFFYIIQIIGSLTGIKTLLNLSIIGAEKTNIELFGILPRASGLINEPTHLSYLIFPIIVIYILGNNINYKIKKTIFIAVFALYMMTFSIIAYFQLIIAVSVKIYRKLSIKTFLISTITVGLLTIIVMSSTIFSNRLNGIINISKGETTQETSVLSFQSNFFIAYDVFLKSPFFGDGLTSHRYNYNLFIYDHFPKLAANDWLGLNQNDAGSLVILLISETGLVGFLFFYIFLFLSLNKFRKDIIGFAFTLSLILLSLRFGNIASVYIILYLMIILNKLSEIRSIKEETYI